MTMIFQLLVFTCACALGAAEVVPAYGNIWQTLEAALTIVQENVLSMEGNVPALNDPRRHYAAIVYVVSTEAFAQFNAFKYDYYKEYQKNINQSLPFAYANPEIIIQETQKRIEDIFNSTNELSQLIRASGPLGHPDSDKAVHKEIKKNVEKYGYSPRILLAAGLAATQLILDDEDFFDTNSKNLTSQQFVITSAKQLRYIVLALKNLYQLLYGPIWNPHTAKC